MHRILLIDDHQDILEANLSYFAEQGFTATACDNGAQAVSLLRTKAGAATGWRENEGKWYYFYADGAIRSTCTENI